MEKRLDEVSNKLINIEKQLHGYKIGGIIFVIVIPMFMYFQWDRIPKEAEKAVNKELTAEVRGKINEAAEQAGIIIAAKYNQIHSGTIIMLSKNKNCPVNSSEIGGLNIQVQRKPKNKWVKSRSLSKDSTWDIIPNYDGRIFKTCLYN